MNCPGSVLATQGIHSPSSVYADEGTAAHTLSEFVRVQNVPAFTFRGQTLKVNDNVFKIGKPMIDGVQTFVDSCAALPGDPYYEIQVAYDEWVPGGFGTADDIRLSDGLCVVTDLKFGSGVQVFANDNAQMKLYALGAFATYGWLYEFDKVVLRICQPRLRHFEDYETTIGKVLQWAYDEVRPAARRAMQPGAPFKAGAWCKFCRAKDSCVVRSEYKRDFETGSGPGIRSAATEFDNLEPLGTTL